MKRQVFDIPPPKIKVTEHQYGIELATATLTRYNQIAFEALASFGEFVLSQVKTATVKNLDETGFRIAGKTQCYRWHQLKQRLTITYPQNQNHYWMVFLGRSSMILEKLLQFGWR